MSIKINNIYNLKCEELCLQLQNESIDLVVTSPPYNVDLGNNKYKKDGYDVYNDNIEHEKYMKWLYQIFCFLLYEKIKVGGRVCINIGDGKNGAVPTHSDIIQMMCERYLPVTSIIWDKCDTSNRAAWGSFCSPSCPSFPKTFEFILVFAKEKRKLQYKGETDITKEEFIKWANGYWRFGPENRMKKLGHPAMFPEELPKRLIKMLSWKDALVFDPFCGLGTTCYVAKQLGRNFIGCDISEDYCNKARDRCQI